LKTLKLASHTVAPNLSGTPEWSSLLSRALTRDAGHGASSSTSAMLCSANCPQPRAGNIASRQFGPRIHLVHWVTSRKQNWPETRCIPEVAMLSVPRPALKSSGSLPTGWKWTRAGALSALKSSMSTQASMCVAAGFRSLSSGMPGSAR